MLQFDLIRMYRNFLCAANGIAFLPVLDTLVSEAKTRKSRQIDAKRNETSKAAIEAAL